MRALFFLFSLSLFSFAVAHPANVASAQAKVQPDGTFVSHVRFDVMALVTLATPKDADDVAMNAVLDGSDEALKKALADAEARFRAGFVSGGALDRLEFPTVADVRRYLASDPKPRLPMMLAATVEGHLPPGTRTIAFRYPPLLDTVIQTVEFPYKEPISEPVERDRPSATLAIPTAEEVAKLAAAMTAPRPKATASIPMAPIVPKKVAPPQKAPQPKRPPAKPAAPPQARVKEETPPPQAPRIDPVERESRTEKALPPIPTPSSSFPLPSSPSSPIVTYLKMGYTHILPEGLDHILFVLGLFLLGSRMKSLLTQVTAFTVAHSITLALAALGIVRLPGSVIEPLIAASIAFVAIENLFVKDVKPWRTLVVFLFGLVHGMGFAEVFADSGLTGRGLIAALLSFNVGVELGQLSVVAMALGAVGWFRQDPRYRRFVVVPGSVAIAAVALFWTAQRMLG